MHNDGMYLWCIDNVEERINDASKGSNSLFGYNSPALVKKGELQIWSLQISCFQRMLGRN